MFGRKHAPHMQTHRQQFMNELGQSFSALRRAAGHAAQGTAERFSPTYDRARHMAGKRLESTRQTVSPMYRQMREGASNMRPMRGRRDKKEAEKHSRMRMLRGLLVTGAAVGAASAAVARRRRQQAEWAEYEPTGFDESRYAEGQSPKQKVAAGAATMADTLSSRAGRIADTLHERSVSMQEKAGQPRETGQAGPSAGPIREPSGPGPVVGGSSGSTMSGSGSSGMGGGSAPLSQPRERLGDPALDFPDER